MLEQKFIDVNEWVPVHTLAGFECCIEYYVNNKGQIKSTKGNDERILKQHKNARGYDTVKLQQRIGRKQELTVYVHKLVAFAFLPAPPTPYGRRKGCSIIQHINNDKDDNSANNLTWRQS